MSFKEKIRENLLDYIIKMYAENEDDLLKNLDYYGYEGKEAFYEVLDQAATALVNLSQYEFSDIYENLRDVKPMKRGVLLCETVDSGGGTYTLKHIESFRGTDIPVEGFVNEWVENALKSPYYADLLAHTVQFGEKTVDKDGVLSGLGFDANSLFYLLVTDTYEFLPVRVNEIFIRFSNGGRLDLYRNVMIDEEARTYDELDVLLEEIIGFGSCLRIAE